ncbi:hypothetical protein [Modestobacter lapidis]|nr:hypothetical protein [Modestobacter lapidis]
MDETRQLADRPAEVRPAPTGPAGARPAWWGLVTLVAGALSVPLVLVDPVFAAALGIVVGVVGVLGARSSSGTERRQHLAGTAFGITTEVLLVLALTVLGSSLGAAAPWPVLVAVP